MNRRRFLSLLGLAPVIPMIPASPAVTIGIDGGSLIAGGYATCVEPGLDAVRSITIQCRSAGFDAAEKGIAELVRRSAQEAVTRAVRANGSAL